MQELDVQTIQALKEFEGWYALLQTNFKIQTYPEEGLATAILNQQQPVHGWYTLKEGYSSRLPVWIVEYLAKHYKACISRVIDPFIGGGTTGVSLALEGVAVDGLEYNPFIRFVSEVKAQYPLLNKIEVLEAINKVVTSQPFRTIPVPTLSTLHEPRYFRPKDIQIILYVIHQIKNLNISPCVRDFLLLGVARSIDDIANLRKDGRALRYATKANRPTASVAIQTNWQRMTASIDKLSYKARFRVFGGSATNLKSVAEDETYELALSSPPYLNNFDYSEIYKLELWLLGFVADAEQWRELRKSTIRSHPSISFDPKHIFDGRSDMSEVFNMLKKMRDANSLLGKKNGLSKIIIGYFEDMYLALKEQWRVLKPGGYMAYVVANSRYNHLPIATDVILGEIARCIGFEPLELIVLKQRNGRTRQKTYLRESAVILRKPI